MAVAESPQLTRRRERIASIAVLLAGGGAVAAALLTGPNIGQINTSVESVSSASTTLLGALADTLPLGYAFGAGMVSAVNPCGFALLPAYLGLYLGSGDASETRRRIGLPFWRAVSVSATMTAGFILVFGVAGVALSAATTAIARYLPWAGLAIGILLVLAAGRMLAGGALYSSFGERIAQRFGPAARQPSTRGFLAYGLAYGTGSLSCTLPVFLTVVGSTLTVNGLLPATSQFVLYALGMGFVITLLTLSTAIFKAAALAKARSLVRYVEPVSAVLLLLAGAYIVYYWLTLGGLLAAMGLS